MLKLDNRIIVSIEANLNPFISLKELATVKKLWEQVTNQDLEMVDMEWEVVMVQD